MSELEPTLFLRGLSYQSPQVSPSFASQRTTEELLDHNTPQNFAKGIDVLYYEYYILQ